MIETETRVAFEMPTALREGPAMSTVSAIYENGVFRPTEDVNLPEHSSVELEVRMRAEECPTGTKPAPDTSAEPERKKLSIEEKIAQIVADVPPEVWDNLPDDLSEQLDHYLYGLPKR